MSQVENVQETSAQRVCVKLNVLTIIIISLVTVQNRKRNKSSEKIDEKTKQNKKSESSSKRDLHDWDRFLGTILYPQSCGEICHKRRANFKIICNKCIYCKEQKLKYSVEN